MHFGKRSLRAVFSIAIAACSVGSFGRIATGQEAAPATAGSQPAGEGTAAAPATGEVNAQQLLEKAGAALKSGDYQAALTTYTNLAAEAERSTSPDAIKVLILAYIGRGDALSGLKEYLAAIDEYKKVLDIDPSIVPANIGRGKARLETGDAEQALADFQNAVKADAANPEANLGLGKALVTLGRSAEAIAPLTKAIEADPKNAEALRLRGTAYAGGFKNKQAIDDLQAAIAADPESQDAYYALGVIYSRMEDFQSAVAQFNKAIEHFKPAPGQEDQLFIQGYLTGADAYIELGKAIKDDAARKKAYESSRELCEKALQQLDSKNPAHAQARAAALLRLGIAQRMLDNYSAAIRSFSEAIELNPELGDAYFRRGICFHKLNEDKMAISDFQVASHLNFGDPRCNLWEGFAYASLGDYNEAIRAYGDAIAASDRYTPAYYNRALAYMMLGDYEKAINDFNESIRLSPANAEYYYKRGIAYAMLKEYQRASESFATAIEFDPKHVEAYRRMGAVLQSMGRNDLAAQYRQKAEELTLPPKK